MTNTKTNAKEMQAERAQVRADVLRGRLPRRVPVYGSFTLEGACGYAGVELIRAQYDIGAMEKAYTAVLDNFYTDHFPVRHSRFPATYQLLGTRNWVAASNGGVQHPEITVLEAGEYDAFTENPYAFIVTALLPRVCAALDTDPASGGLNLARAFAAHQRTTDQYGALLERLREKYGLAGSYFNAQPIAAPFDFVADQLRGFKGITMDIRRSPEKVKAACEAVLPMMVALGTPTKPREDVINFVPLHMAPYINMQKFEELYWPTFFEMVRRLDERGVACSLYVEQDWTRYAGHLAQMPESTNMLFENGDYTLIKKTVGKNHAIGGFYDPTITLSRSKGECIDEAKRLLDTCMEGGRFFFAFDRSIMDIKSIDAAKLQAVLEWVRDNGTY